MSKVYLRKMESGRLLLVDEEGDVIGNQSAVSMDQEVNEITTITVVFQIDPSEVMYPECKEVT